MWIRPSRQWPVDFQYFYHIEMDDFKRTIDFKHIRIYRKLAAAITQSDSNLICLRMLNNVDICVLKISHIQWTTCRLAMKIADNWQVHSIRINETIYSVDKFHPSTLCFIRCKGRMVLCLLLFISSCKRRSYWRFRNDIITLQVPKGFYPVIPSDNQPTQNRIDLGRKIFLIRFFHERLYHFMGSCHHTDIKFTDGFTI